MIVRVFIFFAAVLSGAFLPAQTSVINEFMSSNGSTLFDEDGDASDWIELYNPHGVAVNLDGYYLSDRGDDMWLWAFPERVIPPGGFLTVFASGKDRTGAELHTNFSVRAAGEPLYLTLASEVVDHAPSAPLGRDISMGRLPDGTGEFTEFYTPTPGLPNGISAPMTSLVFSREGGIYAESFDLLLQAGDSTSAVYFTTDGSVPDENARLYDGPLTLSEDYFSEANISAEVMTSDWAHHEPNTDQLPKAITIRAAVFTPEGVQQSPAFTHTYLIRALGNDHGDLPVVSIAADRADLFDFDKGIFVPGIHSDSTYEMGTGNFHQRGREWERQISFEYYAPDSGYVRTDAGLRTHGNISRWHAQKGLRIYARDEYGSPDFDFPFFPGEDFRAYKQLVLKTYSATLSGTSVEDPLGDKLAQAAGLTAAHTRPVVVYINGEYWGLYHLKERIYPETVARKWGVDPEELDIVEDWYGNMQQGDSSEFIALYNFIRDYDLSNPHYYDVVAARIDIDNFIDYQIYEIFIANRDWPANNMKMAKPRREGAKWQWIYFDGDHAFYHTDFEGFENALDTTYSGWPAGRHFTLWLRKLMENPDFYDRFFARADSLADAVFSPEFTKPVFVGISRDLRPEVHRQSLRFGIPESQQVWDETASVMADFLDNRYCVMRKQAEEQFDMTLTAWAHCDAPEGAINENPLIAYPNPVTGNEVTLMLNSFVSGNVSLEMYTVAGQHVFSKTYSGSVGYFSETLQIPGLAPGVYVVTMPTPRAMYTVKVVVDAFR